jgi:hypothetical protein
MNLIDSSFSRIMKDGISAGHIHEDHSYLPTTCRLREQKGLK